MGVGSVRRDTGSMAHGKPRGVFNQTDRSRDEPATTTRTTWYTCVENARAAGMPVERHRATVHIRELRGETPSKHNDRTMNHGGDVTSSSERRKATVSCSSAFERRTSAASWLGLAAIAITVGNALETPRVAAYVWGNSTSDSKKDRRTEELDDDGRAGLMDPRSANDVASNAQSRQRNTPTAKSRGGPAL